MLAACAPPRPGATAQPVPAPVHAATAAAGTTTAGVLCDYAGSGFNPSADADSRFRWQCDTQSRQLSANGIPDHAIGRFPNPGNPTGISAQTVAATMPLEPAIVHPGGMPARLIGYGLNGISFNPGTAASCDDSGAYCSMNAGNGSWRIEALGQSDFFFGTDANNAHVQPDGRYHYHGVPQGLVDTLAKGRAMTLVGWAVDGFPIYARYGYRVADDAGSPITELRTSYRHKTTPDAGRPPVRVYPMGSFEQDWEYVAGSGDLDECNGRTGVTPEFPGGIYHYLVTDRYPYVQRCVKGTAPAPARGRAPAQALEACRDSTAGQACSFGGRQRTVHGRCLAPAGTSLVCQPDGGRAGAPAPAP